MIKKGARFKDFTPVQRQELEAIAKEEGLKNATDVLLLALEYYIPYKNQIARLTKFNAAKQAKIEELQTIIKRYEALHHTEQK